MPFNQFNPLPPLSIDDETYLNQQLSPHSRPMDSFPVKDSDLTLSPWSYDSAIDLFSLNSVNSDPISFDLVDSLTNTNTNDLFINPFETSTAISGFTVPNGEDTVSLSSDFDSDDQSWSSAMRHSIDDAASQLQPLELANQPSRPVTRSSHAQLPSRSQLHRDASSTRWSSSPEISAEEDVPETTTTATGRKSRSYSQDSRRSSTSQDPQTRNAAKRAAHNIIEKRYRTNMNAKFLALEKVISPPGVHKRTQSQGSRASAGSLKKSEILNNALVYIESVQQENQSLRKELALLKQSMLSGIWGHPK